MPDTVDSGRRRPPPATPTFHERWLRYRPGRPRRWRSGGLAQPTAGAGTRWRNFDTPRVKIRGEGLVHNRPVYLATGPPGAATKDVLWPWIEQSEGAKFWLRIMNELKACSAEDVLIAAMDGLKDFPDAITTGFPECVVHLITSSVTRCSFFLVGGQKAAGEGPQGHLRGTLGRGRRRAGPLRSRHLGSTIHTPPWCAVGAHAGRK